MKQYGTLNDIAEGDCIANFRNAVKSSNHRSDGKGAHRNSKKKQAIRTQMNKRTRAIAKEQLNKELKDGQE